MSDDPTYEQAREELATVVQRLEAGGTSLQESVELWQRGEDLARICQRWLDGARDKLRAAVDAAETDQPGGEARGAGRPAT